MNNTYQFDAKEHIHTLDGKPLMGVTTVLKVISKPALIQWAANMAVAHIIANALSGTKKTENNEDFAYLVTESLLEEARTAHRKKKESAGDWGTNVHKAIEEWIKEGKEPELDIMGITVFQKFIDWVKENKVEFLESEKHVWSKDLWIGGIVDLVIKIDGKKYIGDIKTSSGIYDEAFFQMGAYNLCLEEMGEHKDVEGYIVINLRKDGKMELKQAVDMETNKQAFKYALGLHKIINK